MAKFRFWHSYTNGRSNKTYGSSIAEGNAVHVRGWNSGVEVVPRIVGDRKEGRDAFEIYATKGSNGGMGGRILLGRVTTDTVSGAPQWQSYVPAFDPLMSESQRGEE
jgi:hypothetical protein